MMKGPPLLSSFMRFLREHNRPHLEGFRNWVFRPGMLFQSRQTWWGGKKARPSPHEGLDLCTYEDVHGALRRLEAHSRIPAAFAGTVVKIARDFLGQSIFLAHDLWSPDGRQLVSASGHTAPAASLRPGTAVAAGDIIATLADGSAPNNPTPAHLHITFAWVPTPLDTRRLSWHSLGQDGSITLIDPLPVLGLAPPG